MNHHTITINLEHAKTLKTYWALSFEEARNKAKELLTEYGSYYLPLDHQAIIRIDNVWQGYGLGQLVVYIGALVPQQDLTISRVSDVGSNEITLVPERLLFAEASNEDMKLPAMDKPLVEKE